MAYGDTKIVINSLTYDNYSNHILVGITKDEEIQDARNVNAELINSDQRFTALNLRGLSAVVSYDYGSGWVASAPLTCIYQDDITSGGNYHTVLNLVGDMNMLSEDKASKDYVHDATDTKTVKALLTEVLSGIAVSSELTAAQSTMGSYYAMHGGGQIITGQTTYIPKRTVKSIQFYLKKVGSPVGDVTFFIRPTDFSSLVYKVALDASALSTSPAWITATLDTPTYFDDEVYIYCEYQDGNSSNYVAIGYSSSAVKSGEILIRGYATGDWIPESNQDCGYKDTYDIAGVDCFAHTKAYTATYDSQDALIDVYTPGDAFSINEGESRLEIVDRLLAFTACYRRAGDDGAIHIFIKPTSGNSYTSDTGDFYSHTNRKGLVVPNKIVVKSYDDDDGYTGSATSAASYTLTPITGAPVRAYVTGDTQAGDMAAAIIGRYEVNAQVGGSLVPMSNYEEMFNFVTITNNWNGSTTTGNISYISRYSMNGFFHQFISFGTQTRRGIAGSRGKRQATLEQELVNEQVIRWGQISPLFDVIDGNTDELFDKINAIFLTLLKLGAKVELQGREITIEWVDRKIQEYIANAYGIGDTVPRWNVTEALWIPGRY